MCDIVFEKTKGGGGTVNRTSVYAEIAGRSIPWRRCYKKFFKICKKTSVSEYVCRSAISWKRRHFFRRYFLVNFTKFVRTSFLQSTTGRLLLIIAVSIVLKGELANKTVNYDRYQFVTEVKVIKKGSPSEITCSEAVVRRCSSI